MQLKIWKRWFHRHQHTSITQYKLIAVNVILILWILNTWRFDKEKRPYSYAPADEKDITSKISLNKKKQERIWISIRYLSHYRSLICTNHERKTDWIRRKDLQRQPILDKLIFIKCFDVVTFMNISEMAQKASNIESVRRQYSILKIDFAN